MTWLAAENGLSFIETSALDASNVESAFQTILTGKFSCYLTGPLIYILPIRHLPHCFKQIARTRGGPHQAPNRRHAHCLAQCRRISQQEQQLLLGDGVVLDSHCTGLFVGMGYLERIKLYVTSEGMVVVGKCAYELDCAYYMILLFVITTGSFLL